MQKITSGLEDYIESISNHLKENNKVRAVDIARELNVSRASVSEALRRLDEMGYINYGRYGTIEITAKGENAAASVIKRHTLLHKFLTEILGLGDLEASENACKIEHVISEEFINKLQRFVDFNEENPELIAKFKTYLNSDK